MVRPINVVGGHYFLGLRPLPDDREEREAVIHWYLAGREDAEEVLRCDFDCSFCHGKDEG